MEIPKGYIKCINFKVRTEDFSDNYTEQLKYLLRGYIKSSITTGNYTIGFTLIKPLDKYTLKLLLNTDGIEYFDEITYTPYNRDENIDKLIERRYDGNYYDGKYLSYLIQYMPENPIPE